MDKGKNNEAVMDDLWVLNMHRSLWMYSKVGFGNTVLDVGCADGMAWCKPPFEITTLDMSVRENVDVCHPDIVGVVENLPLADNSFDIVSLCEILEHLKEPEIGIKEAIRVAKIKVIMTVPFEVAWAKELNPFSHPGHLHYFIPETFKELLNRFGMPYQIQILSANGFVWVTGEIYCCKDKRE